MHLLNLLMYVCMCVCAVFSFKLISHRCVATFLTTTYFQEHSPGKQSVFTTVQGRCFGEHHSGFLTEVQASLALQFGGNVIQGPVFLLVVLLSN